MGVLFQEEGGKETGWGSACLFRFSLKLSFWNLLWVEVGHKKTLHEVWKVEVNVAVFVVR